MRNVLLFAAVLVVGTLVIVQQSCVTSTEHNHDALKTSKGWCDQCNMGYRPDGTVTKCKSCHSGLHGKNTWCAS